MKIYLSEIQIMPCCRPKNGLLAFANFILNNSFFVGNVAIYSRLNQKGYRLVYPLKMLPNGAPIQCFHPINRQVADAIEQQIVDKFKKLTENVVTEGSCKNEYFGEG